MWDFVQGVTRLQILFSGIFFILHLPHSFSSSSSSYAFPSFLPSPSFTSFTSFVSTSPSYFAASPPLSLFFSPFLSSSTLCSVCICLHACVLSCFSCVQLCATPMDCSLLGSSVCGIFQARIMEWIACPAPGDLPNPGIQCPCIGRQVLYHWRHLGSPFVCVSFINLKFTGSFLSYITQKDILHLFLL